MKRLVFICFICLLLVVGISQLSKAAPGFKVQLVYEVQEGDTLYDLSRKFGVSIENLRNLNDLSNNEFISFGDKLIIPQENSKQIAEQATTKQDKISFYNSQQDTNNYQLNCDQMYEVKVRERTSSNRIDVSNLRTLTYRVRRGDNLYELAREFNTSVPVIKKLNGLQSNVIRLGDKIKLPINNLTPKEVLYHTVSDKEIELLARLIHGEARGEPYIGQVAVGAVIINRVIDSYFPDSIRRVVYQPGQFSPVANGQINLRPNRTSYRAARAALKGKDPTRGACYFYNPDTARNVSWFQQRTTIVRIGNHVFAK